MSREISDAALFKAGSITTYSGATTTAAGLWTVNEIAAVIGAAAAIIGLCMQVYFGRKRDLREARLHEMKLRLYEYGERRTGGDRREPDEHEDAGV